MSVLLIVCSSMWLNLSHTIFWGWGGANNLRLYRYLPRQSMGMLHRSLVQSPSLLWFLLIFSPDRTASCPAEGKLHKKPIIQESQIPHSLLFWYPEVSPTCGSPHTPLCPSYKKETKGPLAKMAICIMGINKHDMKWSESIIITMLYILQK